MNYTVKTLETEREETLEQGPFEKKYGVAVNTELINLPFVTSGVILVNGETKIITKE